MIISETTVKRPYATLMVFIAILILGIISALNLPIELLPKIEMPAVTVIVPYPGASASDVENDITKNLEEELSTVADLDEINSVSKDNLSTVTCQFDWGTDLDVATSDIRNKLDMAKAIIKENAPDSEEPIIFKMSTDMIPVMVVAISAEESWKDLEYIVERDITNPLQRTPGIANISSYGGLEREIKVILNSEKIKAYNISPALIIQRLEEENVDIPLGKIKEGSRDYFFRMKGRFQETGDIEKILLTIREGNPIFLGDVAEVKDDFAEETAKSYQEGRESIVLVIQRQSGENTIAVSRAIRKSLEEIKPSLAPDIRIDIPFDSSDFIVMTIANLRTTTLAAGLIVIFITFLVLRRWKTSFIVSLSIPFSLMVAFTFLYARELTINVISLMSLAISIGMVVDNTIVVTENITRHVEEGFDPSKASVEATREVGGAITASTLTTVIIFLPLVFATGITGILFKQLGSIVAITIFSSLFVALTLTPMLTAKLFRPAADTPKNSLFYKAGESILNRLTDRYKTFLTFCLDNKAVILIPLFAVFAGSLYLGRHIPSEFFPSSDTGQLEIRFSLGESRRLEETDKVLQKIGNIIDEQRPDRVFWYGTAGETGGGTGAIMGGTSSPNQGQIMVKFVPREERTQDIGVIADTLRGEIEKIPGIERLSVSITGGMGEGMQTGQPIEIELTGPDLDSLYNLAVEMQDIVAGIKGTADTQVSFKQPRIEVHTEIDREKAKYLGVNTAAVGQTLRTYFYGYEAGRYKDGDDDFPIFVQLPETETHDIAKVSGMPIHKGEESTILLKDIASITLGEGPVQIDRKDRHRIIIVGCDTTGRPLSEVQQDIEEGIKDLSVPPGISVEMGGEVREQREAFSEMSMLLLLGVLFVYMVMVAQFESFKTPFIIFFSIPFAFIGVIWAMLITGATFSIMSFMALIMLIGVVVNNAIVLVDYTNLLRARGMNVHDAIIKAGSRRMRPVLITILTTSFGMLPLALGKGSGGEMWQPFGITAMGGLLLSGFITLFFIPIIYSAFNKETVMEVKKATTREDR